MGNVSHGPSIVTDGLVLCLDNYNEQSYLGEPTVNLLPSVLAQASSDSFSTYYSPTSKTALTNTLGRKDILQVVCTSSSNSDGAIAYSGDALSSVTVSFSIDVWIPTGKSLLVGMRQYPQGEHGGGSTVTGNSDWQRVEGTYALNSTGTTNLGIQAREVSATDNVTFYLDNLQLEQNSHATKFVDGTRSATDGWQDLSGNDNHADLTQLSYSATNVPGTNVNSFSFDGTNDYAFFGTIDLFSGMSNMSFNAWVNIPSLDSGHHRIASQEGVYYFGRYGGTMSTYIAESFTWSHTSTNMGTLSTGVSMLTWVKSGTTMHHYINGVSTGSTLTMPTTIGDNSNSNFIGSYSSNPDQPWSGDIDVIQAYDRDLSATEVLRNYNANKGRYGL
jgi:hypothetical protein